MKSSPFRNPLAQAITATSLAVSGAAIADTQLEAPIKTVEKTFEAVVVSASGHEQSRLDAPASISVISREELKNHAYKDLTDALKGMAGVTISNGGARQDISMRGLPADYTAILVDGKKQSGRESQPSSSGGFEQDWLPPLEAIERIEIVRGPMSTLYGSDAMGGIINVITRKDYQEWQGNLRAEALIQDNDKSGNHYQGQLHLSGPVIKDLLSASVSGYYQEREEDTVERGYSEKTLDNYRGTLHITPTKQDQISLEVNKQTQERVSTSGQSLPSRSNSSKTNNHRKATSLSHSGSYNWATGTSFIQEEQVENKGREITIKNLSANTQWTIPVNNHIATIGASFDRETLDDASTGAEETSISNEQWSIFSEDEWLIAQNFALTIGLRLDDNEQFNKHLSPRAYGVWSMTESLTLKSGVSTGYRAPELREMSSKWIQESRGGDIYGNPDLDPETSVNTELGLYYSNGSTISSSFTLFHNDFNDKIDLAACPATACGPDDARYNVNIDSAITYGGEATLSMSMTSATSLHTTYTYTHSEQKTGENKGRPLIQTPVHLASAKALWAATDSMTSWMRVTHRGEESKAISETSRGIRAPSVTYTDIGGSWKLAKGFEINVGIYNLEDKEVTYVDFGYVEDGRRYWVALDTQF